MKNKNLKNKEGKNWVIYLILAGALTKILAYFFKSKKHDLKKLVKTEISEMNELMRGEESREEFCRDSFCALRDFFVPHKGNGHRPHVLHPHSLATIAFSLAMLKATIVSFAFLTNPFQAWMSEAIQNQVLALVNQERAAQEMSVLKINSVLNASALEKAEDMIEQGYFAHFSPDGKKPWDFINRNDYAYLFVGENLAMNFTSANSVHKALMDSPSHRKNILNDQYTEVGMAVISGELEGKQTNVLVQMFATKAEVQTAALAKKETQEKPKLEVAESAQEEPEQEFLKEANTQATPAVKPALVKETPKATVAGIENKQFTSQKTQVATPQLLAKHNIDYSLMASAGTSPNSALEKNLKQNQVLRMPNNDNPKFVFFASIFKFANYAFAGALVLMIVFLAVNILVRVKVQHRPVIVQTVMLLFFIAGLAYWQIDVLAEGVTDIFII